MQHRLNKKIKIAIDGYAATGKSSTAKLVASYLNYLYIDSGAMYRAVTFYIHSKGIHPKMQDFKTKVATHIQAIKLRFRNQKIQLNGKEVEAQIRTEAVNSLVSHISEISEVRTKMVSLQQQLGHNKGIVMDGRDIGTTVFADAELKIFMLADIVARTQRRVEELRNKGLSADYEQIKKNLLERDEIDTKRKISPLRKAKDAIILDTTTLTLEQQVSFIVNRASLITKTNHV